MGMGEDKGIKNSVCVDATNLHKEKGYPYTRHDRRQDEEWPRAAGRVNKCCYHKPWC